MSNGLMESRLEAVCTQCLGLYYHWPSEKRKYCSRYCSDLGSRKAIRLDQIPEYRLWKAMRWRCSEKNPLRARYYDRGITVCPRWDSFDNFLNDMGHKPYAKATLDRVDNDLGYSPTNCRWASMKEQANNTSRTNHILLNGAEKITLMDLAGTTGIHPETLRARIKKGLGFKDIIDNPKNAMNRDRDQYGKFI